MKVILENTPNGPSLVDAESGRRIKFVRKVVVTATPEGMFADIEINAEVIKVVGAKAYLSNPHEIKAALRSLGYDLVSRREEEHAVQDK